MSRTLRTKSGNRTIFEIGDKVRLTPHGVVSGMQGKATSPRGVVVGINRSGQLVRVAREGIKTASLYSCAFWEIDE